MSAEIANQDPDSHVGRSTEIPSAGLAVLVSAILAAIVVFLSLLAITNPARFHQLMYEDAFGEWATFYAFLIAGIAGVVLLAKRMRQKADQVIRGERTFRWTLLVVSIFCLAAAGEEISWGQRLTGTMSPEFFQRLNHQQETNVHNVLIHFVSARLVFVLICLGYGLVLPAWAIFQPAKSPQRFLASVAPSIWIAPWFVVAGVVYWIDPVVLSLEACELVLSMSMLADVILKWSLVSRGVGTHGRVMSPLLLFALPLLIAAGNNALMDKLFHPVDPRQVEQAKAELAQIAEDLTGAGAIHPAIRNDERVFDSRIFSALSQDAIRFGGSASFYGARHDAKLSVFERRRRKFFLDPWNNPYWMAVHGTGKVQLYSFGPNRRLETIVLHEERIPTESDLRGDDVSIWVELPVEDR